MTKIKRKISIGLVEHMQESVDNTQQIIKEAILKIENTSGLKLSKIQVQKITKLSYPTVLKYYDEVVAEIKGIKLVRSIDKETELKNKNIEQQEIIKKLKKEVQTLKDEKQKLIMQMIGMKEYIDEIEKKLRSGVNPSKKWLTNNFNYANICVVYNLKER